MKCVDTNVFNVYTALGLNHIVFVVPSRQSDLCTCSELLVASVCSVLRLLYLFYLVFQNIVGGLGPPNSPAPTLSGHKPYGDMMHMLWP